MSGEQGSSTPRCPVRGCPVRYRGGPNRLCPGHQAERNAEAGAGLTLLSADELMGTDRARRRVVNLTDLRGGLPDRE